MATKKLTTEQVDSLGSDLIQAINTKFKNNLDKSAYFLGDPDVANDVVDWVSTGSDILNLAISNRPHGGWPVGRISEITGLEASGKSLLAVYALKETQKRGGLAVYFDTEAATSRDYLEAIGVDIQKLIYLPMGTLEDIFETIEVITEKARKSSKERIVTIVVDSIMGSTTKNELEADYDKDGYATHKAIILSKAMRKITNMISRERICLIFTNQLRTRMNASFGDPYCVDPLTTMVTIKLATGKDSEATTKSLANIGKMFLGLNDHTLSKPGIYDMTSKRLLVQTLDADRNIEWTPLLNFVVKDPVESHWTDGKIKVSGNHRFLQNGAEILACEHQDFFRVAKPIQIVDIEVGGNNTYLANDRLNCNTTSGGKAIPFHASVRVRLKQTGQIKIKDFVAGMKTRAIIQKNRLGPPLKQVDYDIYFDSGIDNYGSWLAVLKDKGLITGTISYTLALPEEMDIVSVTTGEVSKGTEVKFRSKDLGKTLEANPLIKDYVYGLLCQELVSKYKVNEDFGIDDIRIDENFIAEE